MCIRDRVGQHKVVLLKPLTYMNLSGQSIAPAANFYKIPADHVIVLCDDITQAPGKLRIRPSGSAGGHNGLKSIIAELGSASFKRLRVGIGRPKPGETVDYVLSKFEGGDAETFEAVLAASADAVRAVLTGGMSRAMNKFNAWAPPEKSETNQ